MKSSIARFHQEVQRHLSRNGANYNLWVNQVMTPGFIFIEVRVCERQINYYLEGELAIFVLDSEMRKRTKGKIGVDDLMSNLYRKHTIEAKTLNKRNQQEDNKKELTSLPGCSRLGNYLIL